MSLSNFELADEPREITLHHVTPDQRDTAPHVRVFAMDKPGAGGACHLYALVWGTISMEQLMEDAAEALDDEVLTVWSVPEQRIVGVLLPYQHGPIKEFGRNGLTGEALMATHIDRLRHFQAGPFACAENALALTAAEASNEALMARSRDRLTRGVEGRDEA